MNDFKYVEEFEKQMASFFGSPYAVAVDSCTHGLELCLILKGADMIFPMSRTYLSVPMLANKLGIGLMWNRSMWEDYYSLTDDIIDAAVYWREGGYIEGWMMCVSFQYQKHLSLGRGGMILLDNEEDAVKLKKMSYDGRIPNIPWREQNVDMFGYHYYMTPETAKLGLEKLPGAIKREPRKWSYADYPDLTQMEIFK